MPPERSIAMKPSFAAALAAAALTAAPAGARAENYVVAKLGYFGPSGDILAAAGNLGQLDAIFYWEVGLGTNAGLFGLELSGGHLATSAGVPGLTVNVSSIPVLLTAKLRIPIPVVTPYVELGGGAYFNSVDITGLLSQSHTSWGYHVGGGVDFQISALLLGVEARYLSTDVGIPNVTLRVDGVTLTGNVGFLF
jgi:opacity protein-like surface antigen